MTLEELKEYVSTKGDYDVTVIGEYSEELGSIVHQYLEAGAKLPNTIHFLGAVFSIYPPGPIFSK
jgi:hypothetical protein